MRKKDTEQDIVQRTEDSQEFLNKLMKEMMERREEKMARNPKLGRPAYKLNDWVRFKAYLPYPDDPAENKLLYSYDTKNVKEREAEGSIAIVDAFGTFEQEEEPSYDIFIPSQNLLVKHIRQSDVIKKIRDARENEILK